MSLRRYDLERMREDERRSVRRQIVALLESGGLIALPTDTVWGLAALASHEEAVGKLYHLKGKSRDQAIPCLVSGPEQASRFFDAPAPLKALMARFWPGALTVVAPVRDGRLEAVRAGKSTLGLRMPNCPPLIELLGMLSAPLAASSANRSDHPPLADPDAIETEFGTELSAIVVWNQVFSSCASTVLTWTDQGLAVLRAGDLSAQIEAHVND